MHWSFYIIIGFVVGAISGCVLTRVFYFPKKIGCINIIKDPEDGQIYTFLSIPYDPTSLVDRENVMIEVRWRK